MLMDFAKIWIVGKIINGSEHRWKLCGVFSDINHAILVCEDTSYFIGPAYLNNELHNQEIPWVGCYFPLKV